MAVSATKAMFEKKAADQAAKPPELNRERVARVKDRANAIFAQTDEERKKQDPKRNIPCGTSDLISPFRACQGNL